MRNVAGLRQDREPACAPPAPRPSGPTTTGPTATIPRVRGQMRVRARGSRAAPLAARLGSRLQHRQLLADRRRACRSCGGDGWRLDGHRASLPGANRPAPTAGRSCRWWSTCPIRRPIRAGEAWSADPCPSADRRTHFMPGADLSHRHQRQHPDEQYVRTSAAKT